jgi:hypothetical protein
MDVTNYRVPLDIAHKILATFGITQPTRAYDRWVKRDGFDVKDFHEVLYESPFFFIIDWRASLQEELETIAEALSKLSVELNTELNEDGDSGLVACGDRRAAVAYAASDDSDLDGVLAALQTVVPQNIEFRASPENRGSDTSVYAVLPRDEWAELESSPKMSSTTSFFRLRQATPNRTSSEHSIRNHSADRWSHDHGALGLVPATRSWHDQRTRVVACDRRRTGHSLARG